MDNKQAFKDSAPFLLLLSCLWSCVVVSVFKGVCHQRESPKGGRIKPSLSLLRERLSLIASMHHQSPAVFCTEGQCGNNNVCGGIECTDGFINC